MKKENKDLESRKIKYRWLSIHWWRVYWYYFYSSVFSNTNDYKKNLIIQENWEIKEIEEWSQCQCTWVKDMNRLDIYEWDIIIWHSIPSQRYKPKVVEFEKWMFCVTIPFPFWFMPPYTPLDWVCWAGKIEVIGNIFENPELLEATRTGVSILHWVPFLD